MSNIVESRELEVELRVCINSLQINDLMDYTIDSQSGCRLDEFYTNIVTRVFGKNVIVIGDEISDGKYRIKIIISGAGTYTLISKGRFTKKDIEETLLEFVILPFIRNSQG